MSNTLTRILMIRTSSTTSCIWLLRHTIENCSCKFNDLCDNLLVAHNSWTPWVATNVYHSSCSKPLSSPLCACQTIYSDSKQAKLMIQDIDFSWVWQCKSLFVRSSWWHYRSMVFVYSEWWRWFYAVKCIKATTNFTKLIKILERISNKCIFSCFVQNWLPCYPKSMQAMYIDVSKYTGFLCLHLLEVLNIKYILSSKNDAMQFNLQVDVPNYCNCDENTLFCQATIGILPSCSTLEWCIGCSNNFLVLFSFI